MASTRTIIQRHLFKNIQVPGENLLQKKRDKTETCDKENPHILEAEAGGASVSKQNITDALKNIFISYIFFVFIIRSVEMHTHTLPEEEETQEDLIQDGRIDI